MSHSNDRSGVSYFFQGFDLIQVKGIRLFVFVPLMVNLLLFTGAFYYLYQQLDAVFLWLDGYIPDWLSWLDYLLWPLAVIAILVVFSFIFSSIANWIAAPFNGLLAEKVELHLTNQPMGDSGLSDIIKDVPRTLSREWSKLVYYIPRAIGFFLIFLFVPVFGQLIWFLFTAWIMAIQYCDYPFDNHKISFQEMRQQLSENKSRSYSFGLTVTLFAMLPIINFVVMPVAICGATAMWVDQYREKFR
ncbi:sulfate transporter CysZ [Alteromonadaceae bacterium BrNp21-10]|nr:sulfate transporter CysZ [Alteromonadaceae bacterium BrNp21-10]